MIIDYWLFCVEVGSQIQKMTEECLNSGHVEKKYSNWLNFNAKKGNFHQKYLVLTETHLMYYYKKPKSKSVLPTKVIPLWEIKSLQADQSNLLVCTKDRPNGYTFKLKDQKTWEKDIQTARINIFLKGNKSIPHSTSFDFFTENPEANFVEVGFPEEDEEVVSVDLSPTPTSLKEAEVKKFQEIYNDSTDNSITTMDETVSSINYTPEKEIVSERNDSE